MKRCNKAVLVLYTCTYLLGGAHAQYFERLGPGVPTSTHCLLNDTINDVLYIGGTQPGTYDTLVASAGILRWDGSLFAAVGCGFDGDCVPSPNWGGVQRVDDLCFWNGELYACGEFIVANGYTLNHIARFDGTWWQPLGLGMDGPVRGLKAYPDGLYAAGWFTMADTVPANGLARWDGTRWHSVHDLPCFLCPDQPVNLVNDVAIFEGQVYICGVFSGPGDLEELARFDGSEWVPVGEGIRGSLAKVLHLDLHDSLLYISGAFADTGQYGNPQNPASGIVGWDGEDWVELGEGTDGANLPWVTNVAWHNDTLYACGDYNRIGGIPAGGLAYWAGGKWCAMLPAPPTYAINCLALYHDTLHVGGYIYTLGEDTLHNTGKWVYGSHVEECGEPMGETELLASPEAMSVTPTHDPGVWSVQCGRNNLLSIHDVLGRPLFEQRMHNAFEFVDLGLQASGILLFRCVNDHGQVSTVKVPCP